MASTMSSQSILPTIKCSTCGFDIEISSLADHVCVPPPPQSMASHQKFHVVPANSTIGPQAQAHQFLPHSFTPGRDPAIQEVVPYSRQVPIIREDLNIQPGIQIPQANPGVQQGNSPFGHPVTSRSKAGFLRPGRSVPPQIDSAAASKSVQQIC